MGAVLGWYQAWRLFCTACAELCYGCWWDTCFTPPLWPGVASVLCACLSVGMFSCPNTCSQRGLAHTRQDTACRSHLKTDLLWGCCCGGYEGNCVWFTLEVQDDMYPPLPSQRSHHVLPPREQEETSSPSYKLGDLRKAPAWYFPPPRGERSFPKTGGRLLSIIAPRPFCRSSRAASCSSSCQWSREAPAQQQWPTATPRQAGDVAVSSQLEGCSCRCA